MEEFRDPLRNIERNTKSTATGAWVGAGFQAATAFQTARAAQAAEEQLELQRARNEQEQVYQFANWRQTPEGIEFVAWRERAVRLAQALRNRDAEWLSTWARVIGRAQAETPEDEKQRFIRHPARLRQNGLKIAAIVSFVIAALYAVGFAFQVFSMSLPQPAASAGTYTYEQCLADLEDPENFLINEADCDAIAPQATAPTTLLPLVFFLAAGTTFVVLRHFRRRAALADPVLINEAQSRLDRWGFDPLAVQPGYAAFPWHESQAAKGYSDRLMHLALNGHTSFPSKAELITLAVPPPWPPAANYPAEVNGVLEKFRLER